MAPLTQRPRSPPGGPRPTQAASDKKESEGRGAQAPAPGKPESAGPSLLLRETGGVWNAGFHRRKGAPCGGCVCFHPLAFLQVEELLKAGILFLKIGFVGGDPGSRSSTLRPARGSRGSGCLPPRGGGGAGGAASVGAAGPGEFPRVVGGGGISSRRGGGRAATLLDARPASAPRTPASLFGALGVRFRWAPSGAEQKTFPFPIPRSLLFFLAA